MKILHVTPSYYPAVKFGGPVKSVHLLNKSLVESGIQVDVFTTNAGLEDDSTIQLKKWINIDGVRVKYFGFIGYEHYNFSPSIGKQLLRDVKKYDLVHITAVWNFPVLAAVVACRKHNVPYVISPRGTIYPETIGLKSALIKKIYLKVFGNYCLNNASTIHYTSDDERDKVSGYLQIKTPARVIYNGINLKSGKKSDEAGDIILLFNRNKYILFLGRITKKKGLDILIQAFAKINKQNNDIKLIIAGPDNENYKTDLLNQINTLGISGKVLFPGLIDANVKEAAYKNALVFVLPSYSENFGMTVAEAMDVGVPVIISNKVGIYTIVEKYNAGLIISPNTDELVDALESILEDPYKRNNLVKNGKELVSKEFNIKSISNQFKELYQTIIESS